MNTDRSSRTHRSIAGQATVEAAFLLPTFFLVLLLLAQPGILLYDKIVMEAAATQGARLASTSAAAANGGATEEVVRSYLGAIPPIDIFHIHDGSCTYEVTVSGDESSSEVTVSIVNHARALPLAGFLADGIGVAEDGVFSLVVEAREATQPGWVWDSGAGAPDGWAAGWM